MLDSFRHFVLIVEHGTFTAAARHAHLSQPALTASIQRLEERAGARLFHRGRRGASLTAEGEALLPRARAALSAVEDGLRAVAEVSRLDTGRVVLGGGATVCTYLLPPILADLARAHPGVRYELRESTTDEALEALEKGELDLVIVSDGRGERWREDELIWVGTESGPVEDSPVVTLRERTTTRAHLDRLFPNADIVMELNSIAGVKGNVRAGVGIALLSRAAVERELADGTFVELPHRHTPIRRTFSLVHRGLERLPPATAALRRMMLAER
jgi:DNA-binding transcriptional LysR family regulator